MKKWLIIWVVSIALAAGASAAITVQVRDRVVQARILSGSDVGFRVEGQREELRTDTLTGRSSPVDVLTGRLMLRVNGQWVEAELSGGRVRPATN